MSLETARRIASEILGAGGTRVRIKPAAVAKAADALTREDIRALVKDGSIYSVRKFGVSRARGREKAAQKAKGRRRGAGSRKGLSSARLPEKSTWISLVRAERAYIRGLFSSAKIEKGTYKHLYRMVKGGFFSKGRSQILAYLKDNKLMKG